MINIGLRFALYATLLPLFGLAVFGLYGPILSESGTKPVVPLRWLLIVGAVLGLLLSLLGTVVMTAAMMGVGIADVAVEDVGVMLTAMAAGTALLFRALALALVLVTALLLPRWPTTTRIASAVSAGLALATLTWAGHGGMETGRLGLVHAGSDVAHLLAAGAWLGGLLALASLLFSPRPSASHLASTHLALTRFATVGTVAVGLLVLTGLVNGWLLIGIDRLPMLWTSLYGQLLLIKLALFVVMLALAASNRFRLTPALGRNLTSADPSRRVGDLRISLAVESAAAIAILALVAWLGTLSPPVSA